MSSPSYLVQILLPKETGEGQRVSQKWFEDLLKEFTEKFGGATSVVRAPTQGLWRRGSGVAKCGALRDASTLRAHRASCVFHAATLNAQRLADRRQAGASLP
jgi:hypothetical protein